ncbi:MAG: exodeoxyribonuclease VII large subunit [Arenimonas sp.]|nr:exodeoxyribonuclease VII large subunit [Arenimonas sp.]
MSELARERPILKPAQLNALARDLLEGSFAQVWVQGEISNFSRPGSGHLYFTLKDERAQVRCALFKQKATYLRFTPRDGLQVLVRGRLTVYEARGDYQLVLEHMEEAGEGALRQAFEALKLRLAAEGLFAPERKRPLPRFIRHLGLITSARGAAVQDVLSVLSRRFPMLEIDVLPVAVQGQGAAAEIRGMLARAADCGRYDALLITRGGGSLEDLWAFNDEALARAIVASPVPVVSAVGHEIDFSLADFAADLRAPTPSAAAELLVPERFELLAHLAQLRRRLDAAIARQHTALAQRNDQAGLRLQSLRPQLRLALQRHRAALLELRLRSAVRRRIDQGVLNLQGLARALHSVSPFATLSRGYAIVRDPLSGAVLRRSQDARVGQELDAQLAEGAVRVVVTSLNS